MTMQKGERVRWYVYASTNFEIHSPHWHGHTVTALHMRTDVLSLMSMGMVVADMVPDNPGTWLFHCHVGPHFDAGMIARYTVVSPPGRSGSLKEAHGALARALTATTGAIRERRAPRRRFWIRPTF
ncbi:MAG TPA: multicopper oxidase domain-containing protein, partial [Thermoanaerobaculia bacterium]|nr:multicopper oxidase domain-containing protein [Thermoanaerobaculia bacterium]